MAVNVLRAIYSLLASDQNVVCVVYLLHWYYNIRLVYNQAHSIYLYSLLTRLNQIKTFWKFLNELVKAATINSILARAGSILLLVSQWDTHHKARRDIL